MKNSMSAVCYYVSTYDDRFEFDMTDDAWLFFQGDLVDKLHKTYGESKIDKFSYYDRNIKYIKISFRLKVKRK